MGEESVVARCASEAFGTSVLVATICLNVFNPTHFGGLSIACSLMAMVYALGKSSGAQFNPAVSLALGLAGKQPWPETGRLVLVQMFSGAATTLVCFAALQRGFIATAAEHDASRRLAIGGAPEWWQAGLAEMLFTFVLSFVVLNVAASKAHGGKTQFYGLAIGFVIVAAAGSISRISGCFLNPAAVLPFELAQVAMPDVVPRVRVAGYSGLWTLFETAGCALASLAFRAVRPEDFGAQTQLFARLASEFTGTSVLVLTVGLSVAMGRVRAPTTIAASLASMVFALGSVSGAHFNPAVTFAVALSGRGKVALNDVLSYVGAQFAGGYCGALLAAAITHGYAVQAFVMMPGGSGWLQVSLAECFYTTVLAFVVLSVATVKPKYGLAEFFGLAIGVCVVAGGFAVGHISGAALNPAVAIGVASVGPLGHLKDTILYTVSESFGGVVAALLFRLTQPSEYHVDAQRVLEDSYEEIDEEMFHEQTNSGKSDQ